MKGGRGINNRVNDEPTETRGMAGGVVFEPDGSPGKEEVKKIRCLGPRLGGGVGPCGAGFAWGPGVGYWCRVWQAEMLRMFRTEKVTAITPGYFFRNSRARP